MKLLDDLWTRGSIRDVAEGVLGATAIWGEDLNKIPGLLDMVSTYLGDIDEKGMLAVVKEIL